MYRQNQSSFGDILETLKVEYDKLIHEANRYKSQKEEYERKLQSQLGELASVHASIQDLDRRHKQLKLQYEEDLYRLQNMHRSSRDSNAPSSSVIMPPKDQNTFPSITKGTQKDSGLFGFQSSLGKRKLEENGSMGPPHSLPRLEMPPDVSDRSKQQPPPHRIHQIPISQHNSVAVSPNRPSMPSPQPQHPQHKEIRHDLKPIESKQTEKRTEELDSNQPYRVTLNTAVQTSLKINMAFELEHSSVVCCVKFSNDGKYLATGCNRKAQLFDADSGKTIAEFTDKNANEGDLYLRSICFSPDGKYLACGAEDKTVKLWDIETKEMAHIFTGHTMDIYSVDYSSDGRFIVSGSGDKKARIWDVAQKKCIFTLGNDEVGPKDGVTSVAISPDGRLIAAGSLDRVVRLWDAQTGYFLERYEGHTDSVYSVSFSPDGKSLASGSLDRTVKLWDLSESRSRSQCRSTFSGHSDFVLSVAFSADGNWLISGSKDRTVQFWDPRSTVSNAILEGHKNSVISVAVNPDNKSFATGSGDFHAKLWRYSNAG